MKSPNNIDDEFIDKVVDAVFECAYPSNNKFVVCVTREVLDILNKKYKDFRITNNCIYFGNNYFRFVIYNSTNPINIIIDSKWYEYLNKNTDYIEFCKKYDNL